MQQVSPGASKPAQDLETYPPVGQSWRLLIVLSALYALSMLDRQVIGLLLDSIRAELHINDFQVSLLQGLSFALFYAVFGLAFGRAVDQVSRRGVVLVGVNIWSLSTAACGLARNFSQLALARFGVGAGEAALAPAAYSMIADSFPKARLALAMAVFAMGASYGTALSSAVGGLLLHLLPNAGITVPVLGHLATWRAVFLITGVPGFLLAWLIMLAPEPIRRGGLRLALPMRETGRFMADRWRFFLGHFTGFGGMSLCSYGLISWEAVYFHRHFGWEIPTIAGFMAVSTVLGTTIGPPMAGLIADRWFKTGCTDAYLRVGFGGGLLQMAFVLLAMWTTNPYVALALIFGFSVVGNVTGPAAAAIQLVSPSEFRGQLSAAYILVFNFLAVGCGASIVGAFTTFLYHDDAGLGSSIALTYAIFMPASLAMIAFAMKPMREAVRLSR